MSQRYLRSLLPHTSPLPKALPSPKESTPPSQRRPIFASADTCSHADVLWFPQSAFIGSMHSQPLPTSWASCSRLPRALLPPLFWAKGISVPVGFPSPASIYPVPPALANSPGAHLCVQTPQGLGASLNILHVSTKRFPFAPMGKGEGGPLFFGL